MCELSVYMVAGGKKELVMDSVVRIVVMDGRILFEGILGGSKEVDGKLKEINILSQEVLIEA
ncbi:MAG: CooT family nickel-binding protein [Methanothrix sp.]|jgi:predicted RNA-binding protein|uniref:CooT family nickel-binding protein n=1 Tax=Methanothrix sp. TaxID=90426 RepID=UPI00247D7F15|nr:CooT family nickel-binding protein [Methanothrix sp.]